MVELKPVRGTNYYLWKYLPSLPASIIVLVLFTIITTGHFWHAKKSRNRVFVIFAIGGLCQMIGYAVRIACHWYTDQIAPYAIQSCFIVIAPVFYAAAIYMTLGRIIRSVHGDCLSLIRPTRLTKIFVWGDFITLNIQGNGAGLTANDKHQKIGEAIVITGLFFQIVLFGFFIVAVVVFHKRMRECMPRKGPSATHTAAPWRRGLNMLYACSVLIMVRSIFRVVEYIQGLDGYLLSNEWPLYVFDAVLMLAVQVIFYVWSPEPFLNPPPEMGCGEDGHVMLSNEPSICNR